MKNKSFYFTNIPALSILIFMASVLLLASWGCGHRGNSDPSHSGCSASNFSDAFFTSDWRYIEGEDEWPDANPYRSNGYLYKYYICEINKENILFFTAVEKYGDVRLYISTYSIRDFQTTWFSPLTVTNFVIRKELLDFDFDVVQDGPYRDRLFENGQIRLIYGLGLFYNEKQMIECAFTPKQVQNSFGKAGGDLIVNSPNNERQLVSENNTSRLYYAILNLQKFINSALSANSAPRKP